MLVLSIHWYSRWRRSRDYLLPSFLPRMNIISIQAEWEARKGMRKERKGLHSLYLPTRAAY
eukprot:1160368-Pelagomonas_calceolata.AAC.7